MPDEIRDLIGVDPSFQQAVSAAHSIAKSNVAVLIYGETGTGKGRTAELIHRASGREGRFVSVNCATFQPSLFESELFGHTKGAFTGAEKDTPGLFEVAAGGTLFLDEIGDTPAEIQPKLLRALDEGVVRRVGGRTEIKVDARLICATNKDLSKLIEEGKFREDLYYRINSYVLKLPSLRERREDIPMLARHFLREFAAGTEGPDSLSDEAQQLIARYHWPGNVRELRSSIASAFANAQTGSVVESYHLPRSLHTASANSRDEHLASFRMLYLHGANNRKQWAQFLVALNAHIGSSLFTRRDIVECLRHVRGTGPSDNALAHEWQRRLRPALLTQELATDEGVKLRIDLEACRKAIDPPQEPKRTTATDNHSRSGLPGSGYLPSFRTRFVGRAAELEKLRELAEDNETNVLTIAGPGGTGKTRIAVELARNVTDEYPGGVWFADLAAVRHLEGICYAIAHAFGVQLTENEPAHRSVASLLESRPPLLLILDNFEQLVDLAANAVGDWANHAPHVRFVVTSRNLLGLEGEREFELAPLGLPSPRATIDEIGRSDAVCLFVERARMQNTSFQLTHENVEAVVGIARHLDGMPLAIELAAARTAVMEPAQILSRFDKLFALLRSTRRDINDRHSSLEATIDWSYQLLKEHEREAFRQLSVFEGGFYLDAAEELLDFSNHPEAPPVVDMIQGLRQKSLLRSELTSQGLRFGMYRVIQDFAATRRDGETPPEQLAALHARHADYYFTNAQKWAAMIKTDKAVEALNRLDSERGNLRAALAVFGRRKDDNARSDFAELALVADALLQVRGPTVRRTGLLHEAREKLAGEVSPTAGRLLLNLAAAELDSGHPQEADKWIAEAGYIAEKCDNDMLRADVYNYKAIRCGHRVEELESLRLFDLALNLFKQEGNEELAARTQVLISQIISRHGKIDEAMKLVTKAETKLRELGALSDLATATFGRGIVASRATDKPEEALQAFRDAEDMLLTLGDFRRAYLIRTNMGVVLRQQRKLQESVDLLLQALADNEHRGFQSITAFTHTYLGDAYLELDELDKAEEALRKSNTLFERFERWDDQAVALINLVSCSLRRRNLPEARERFARVLGCRGVNLPRVAPLRLTIEAEIALLSGAVNTTSELSREAVQQFEEQGMTPSPWQFRALAVSARSLSGLGRIGEAEDTARRALTISRSLGFKPSDPSAAIRANLADLAPIRS